MANVVKDVAPHELPPSMWSGVRNMRFRDGRLEKFLGHQEVTTTSVAPYWLLEVVTPTQLYWVYAGAAKVYEWHAAAHNDITRSSGGDYTGAINAWTGGVLNGIPVLNNGVDVPQMWSPPGSGTRLTALSNWPAAWRCAALRPYKRFLVAMDVTKSGTRYPQLVVWSHPADPGAVPSSWDVTDDTVDAGENPLAETNGAVVDGGTLRDAFMVYKEDAVYKASFVGGSRVLDFQQVSREAGILARNCIATFVHKGPRQAVFGVDDCFVTDGTNVEMLFRGTWRKWLYSQIEPAYYHRCFAFANYAFTEVWFCFPETGQTLPSKALVWNWVTGQIGARDLQNFAYAATGGLSLTDDSWDADDGTWDDDTSVWDERMYNPTTRKLFFADSTNSKIHEGDVSGTFNGTAFEAYAERVGLTVVRQDVQGQLISALDQRKLVTEVWPVIDADPGTVVEVQVGSQERVSDAVSWQPAESYTVGTSDKVNALTAGRAVSVRFRSTGIAQWSVAGYDLEVRRLGTY